MLLLVWCDVAAIARMLLSHTLCHCAIANGFSSSYSTTSPVVACEHCVAAGIGRVSISVSVKVNGCKPSLGDEQAMSSPGTLCNDATMRSTVPPVGNIDIVMEVARASG